MLIVMLTMVNMLDDRDEPDNDDESDQTDHKAEPDDNERYYHEQVTTTLMMFMECHVYLLKERHALHGIEASDILGCSGITTNTGAFII